MQLYINILHPYLNRIFDQKYVAHFYFAFHLMAMSNSCLNPFIYGVMSSKFRAGFLHYWHWLTTSYGSVTDHFRHSRNINESIMLTASFQKTKTDYKVNLTPHNYTDDTQATRMSAHSTLPLISLSRRESAYD
ncbi:unnamed protein product [Rotaria sp. Silwood2]|nr:unnamed protein product [Rotaria sp. Silwood2]